MRRIFAIAGCLLAIGFVGLGIFAWTPSEGVVDRQALFAKASQYDVTIYRDTWGVPHVYGKRDADVTFGLAFAHSEDDWQTMQEVVAMARGTLSQYKGKSAAQTDFIVDFLRIWDLVDAKYETEVSPDTKLVLDAYADGLNLYGAQHAKSTWSGILPITGRDLVAGYVLRMPFFYGIEKDFEKIFDAEGFSPSATKEAKQVLLGGQSLPIGSNAFALSPSRSEDGVTRLLVNSHQPFTGPVAWYEARLKSEEGLDIVGGTFPGSPFIGHGFTRNLGWANTVNDPDVVDVYSLKINPDIETQYLFDGEWLELDVRKTDFRVKLWGPFSWPVHREFYKSVHGPALKLSHGAFAIRYAGMDEVRQAEQFYKQNKAANLKEWQAALAMQAISSLNYIYADREGNIAYLYNATFPKRDPKFEWQGLLPGDTSDALWTEYMPFDSVPYNINPKSGFLINANNTPFRATEPTSDLYKHDYPEWFGIQTNMTNRSLRALERFSDDPKISFEEFAAVKYDNSYSASSEVAELMAYYASLDATGDEALKEIQHVLSAWDLRSNIENENAALALLTANLVLSWSHPITDNDKKLEVLRNMAAQLKEHYGSLTPTWGEVNRLKRGDINLPVNGGPDTLRAIYGGSELDDMGQLTALAGDTLFYFVAWDKDGTMSSQGIHQFGSATLDETSPHYADQALLFAAEKMKPVWFDFEDLELNIERTYHLGYQE